MENPNESFLSLMINEDLDRKLRKLAAEQRTSRSDIVRQILQDYVEKHNPENVKEKTVAG